MNKLAENESLYSLAQKHCTKFSNEKSMVFLTVKLYEILLASTYGIYEYMVKMNNLPRLVRRHQPLRAAAD